MNFPLKKFLSYYKPYLRVFIAVMICAFIATAVTLVFPLLIRYITKDILESNTPDLLGQIYQIGAVMLGLTALRMGCEYFLDYKGHEMGAMMESDMRNELFDHYQKLSFTFYDNQKVGRLMSRITNDLLSLTELYHHGPEDLVLYFLRFIGAFIILFGINARLTLIVFSFMPFMLLYTLYFAKKLRKASKISHNNIGDVNAQVEDTLSGIRVVKSFTNEAAEKKKFLFQNNRFLESRKTIYKNEARCYQGIITFIELITVSIVIFGGAAITNSTLDVADMITFLLYVGYLTEPIQHLLHVTTQYQEGIAGFERFYEIINTSPDISDSPNAIEMKDVKGNIKFNNVVFGYNENSEVLQNVSLDVKAGEYIALVGTSGSGKTTLCSLIPRFYEIEKGEIFLDEVNIKDIQLSSLRKNIGVVQQEVYLFAGTIYDNIAYGKPKSSREEIINAAKLANAHDFIMELSDGYDSDIGQRGIKLSGGQKQRISIARLFLKNPPVLIFDEATSSLDNESEHVVQDSLEQLAKNRTTFVIAHRLSTIRNAKRILVLTNNGIEEQGTHEELIQLNKIYAKLYNCNSHV